MNHRNNTVTQQIAEHDKFHYLTIAYNRYMDEGHGFATNAGTTNIELHTLQYICMNPGCTVTDIVNYWNKSKGTISVQLSNLEKKGYIVKEKYEDNGKLTFLYPTDKGTDIDSVHRKFNRLEAEKFRKIFFSRYTQHDYDMFTEILGLFTDFFNAESEKK